MNDLHAGLDQYRNQLRDAIDRDLDRRGKPSGLTARDAVKFGVPAVAAAAAAATLIVALPGGAPVRPADAAILRHVAAALAPAPRTILHERATVSAAGLAPQPYELWAQSDPPHAYRVIKWGHEGSWDGSRFLGYDRASNTISLGPSGPPGDRGRQSPDIAATLRSMVQSGQAQVRGTTTIEGVVAYRLSVSGSTARFLNGTAYVSRRDYHPLLIETTDGGGQRINYETYEYLPANARNLALLDLASTHPGARLVAARAYQERSKAKAAK